MLFPRESLDLVERCLVILSTLVSAALVLRLVREKLHKSYKFFCIWLIAEVIRATVLLSMPPRSSLFGYTFFFTEPVIWILYFLIIWELYSLVLKHHPGIAAAGHWTMVAGLLIAAVFVGIGLRGDLSNPGQPYPLLTLLHVAGRAIVSTLGVFLLLVTLVVAWFPIPLSRNIVYYCVGYAIFFCMKAVLLLGRNVIGPQVAQYLSIVNQVVATGCIVFWLMRLSRSGEYVSRSAGARWSPGKASRLLAQLNRINEALLNNSSREAAMRRPEVRTD